MFKTLSCYIKSIQLLYSFFNSWGAGKARQHHHSSFPSQHNEPLWIVCNCYHKLLDVVKSNRGITSKILTHNIDLTTLNITVAVLERDSKRFHICERESLVEVKTKTKLDA